MPSFSISPAGVAPFLQLQSSKVFKGAYAAKKITTTGYYNMLLKAPRPNIISQGVDDGTGHIRNVSCYALQRSAAGTTSTSDDCLIDEQPTRIEFTVPTTLFRKKSFYLDDRQLAAYMSDASEIVKANGQMDDFPGFTMELWDLMITRANALIADINKDLLGIQAAAFGVNKQSGTNAIRTINFNRNATVKDYSSGLTLLEDDAMQNEFMIDEATIVYGGLMNRIMVDLNRNAISSGLNGINDAKLAIPNHFFDPYCGSIWGDADAFAVFDADSVQLLEINRYKGAMAGDRGISWFGTIFLPLKDSLGNDQISGTEFDIQIKYIDCPTTVEIGGTPTAVNRGWQVTLSKCYHQINVPSNSYTAADPLYGNNGTLLYKATNTSVS